jgi:hypothetical protein
MTRLGTVFRRGRWYAARLAAMPPAEIPHRFAEAMRRMRWRRQAFGWQAFASVGDGEIADLPALRCRLARLAQSECGRGVRESVQRMCDGRFRFLGQDWPCLAADADEPPQFPPTFCFMIRSPGKRGRMLLRRASTSMCARLAPTLATSNTSGSRAVCRCCIRSQQLSRQRLHRGRCGWRRRSSPVG